MTAGAISDNPRRNGGDQGIVEMTEQRPEPSLGRHAVGVHERDDGAVHRSQPGIAGAGRSDIGGQPDERGAVSLGDLLGRPGIS